MALSEKEILEVLELFQKSGWEDMQLQSGHLQLSISKTPRAPAAASAPIPPRAATPSNPRWVAVTAPMLGTFYAAPKPGAPPFVTVGQEVSADDTVAILEVMKLMNHIKAGTRGRIAQILVSNGELVEFEQLLIYIDPVDRSA